MRLGLAGAPRAPSGAALLAAALLGCGPSRDQAVSLVDGATATRFPVQSAYAEYIELPGMRNELRLTLADYAVSCERWIPPKEGTHALTLVVATPSKDPPKVGSYAWTGVVPEGPLAEPYALPKVLIGDRSRLFEPGGMVRLTEVGLDAHGTIRGTLAFEFPGDANRPATRITGNFEAKMCRWAPAPR